MIRIFVTIDTEEQEPGSPTSASSGAAEANRVKVFVDRVQVVAEPVEKRATAAEVFAAGAVIDLVTRFGQGSHAMVAKLVSQTECGAGAGLILPPGAGRVQPVMKG